MLSYFLCSIFLFVTFIANGHHLAALQEESTTSSSLNELSSNNSNNSSQLALQKPQFDLSKTSPSIVWINGNQGANLNNNPLIVYIRCTTKANPVTTKIHWFYEGVVGRQDPILPSANLPSSLVGTKVYIANDQKNGSFTSLATLRLNSIGLDQLRNLSLANRYTCEASNEHGKMQHSVELKVGYLPDRPQITELEYRNGAIHLQLNHTKQVPPIDMYRLEVGTGDNKSAHLFKKSNGTVTDIYFISFGERPLTTGEYPVAVAAHNAIGWSAESISPYRSGTYFVVVPALSKPDSK